VYLEGFSALIGRIKPFCFIIFSYNKCKLKNLEVNRMAITGDNFKAIFPVMATEVAITGLYVTPVMATTYLYNFFICNK
jgi:hypothetical protein